MTKLVLKKISNPKHMLLLFQKEECPFCSKVRHFMTDNEISFLSVSSAKGSPSRRILTKLGGKDQLPYLVDLDAGVAMYEAEKIIDYLDENFC